MRVIGLCGKAGAGKDTVADYLVDRYGFVKYSLASPIKAGLNAMFGFTPDQWNDRDWKETPLYPIQKSPRQLAQTLGTEWGRNQVSGDLWLWLAQQFITQVGLRVPRAAGVVISDIRFDNEAFWLTHTEGALWQVLRAVAPVSKHASEKGVNEKYVERVLHNHGSMQHLRSQIDAAFVKSPFDDESRN